MAKKKSGVSIIPLADRVLVKIADDTEGEKTTESGIIIPETVKDDMKGAKRGEVVAIGAGRLEDGKRIPVSVKVGDEVLFSWGEELEIDGETYHLVNESNILAVVN